MAFNEKKRDKACLGDAKRHQRLTCMVSEEELHLVNRYLEKYNISNKSRWMRETLLMFIHKQLEEDYPTLFKEHDMRR